MGVSDPSKREMKRIILLEFKRTSDQSETYYTDMRNFFTLRETKNLVL